jgi:CBS-domain-containing membrane protein
MGPKSDLIGVVTDRDLQHMIEEHQPNGNGRQLADLIKSNPVIAYPGELLRVVVYRMAETGVTRLPVVARDAPRRLVGIISLSDLLKARVHHLEEERRRERTLQMRLLAPLRSRRPQKSE